MTADPRPRRLAAPLAVWLACCAAGCSGGGTPMTVDADRVGTPSAEAVEGAPTPAKAGKKGEIRSPKDGLLVDEP